MATLLAAYTDPGAHRDVRAAIASAARQRPGDDESWTILDSAVSGSQEERQAVLAASPYGLPDRFRPRYAALIVRICRDEDPYLRAAAFSELPVWLP
jgi:hypothetical protein